MSILKEGDFVMGSTSEGIIHGVIEHIMTEGGVYGVPGTEYAIQSMPPENPAMAVRVYKKEGGTWKPTAYSIGMMYKDAQIIDMNSNSMNEDDEEEDDLEEMDKFDGCCPEENIEKQAPCWKGYVQRGMKPGKNGKPVPNCVPAAKADDLFEDDDTVEYNIETMSKAEGYSPPAGARAAARKAIKFKEQGKANGAGTSVGWTRAGQLARGESISLSTVKRMYSYFSRHEVDKKGKDWANQANPSNGYIMWLAWGGDAGYSWSRKIANAERDKALFANIFESPISKTSQRIIW